MLDRFNEFDKEHPEFWDQFKFFTLAAIDSGRGRFSARVIWALGNPTNKLHHRIRD